MADMTRIKGRIAETIYPNGTGAITAESHQALLLEMVDDINAKKADKEEVTTVAESVSILSQEVESNRINFTESLDALEQKVDNLPQGGGDFNPSGTYPDLTAGDLAGRGESVPAEFGFRASGGKSIKDGRAYIKRIKGNSVVWNQKIKSFAEADVTPYETDYIVGENNSVVVNNWLEYRPFRWNIKSKGSQGHKYLVLFDYKNTNDSQNIAIELGGTYVDCVGTGTVAVFNSAVISDNYGDYFSLFLVNTMDNSIVTLSNLQVIDLTKMFGEGYEPTTIEEFQSRVATLGIDMYAYNEGQVIHCNTESIKSIGDNAWDEQWRQGFYYEGEYISRDTQICSKNPIQVLPNESYRINQEQYYVWYYDKEMHYIGYDVKFNSETFVTPSNAAYIHFNLEPPYGVTYKNDVIVTLVHSDWKQGYQPYWQDTLPLPIIRKYFPQGMKSAGSAHDEIRFNKATKKWEYSKGKIKSVDLGSLTWDYYSSSNTSLFKAQFADIKIGTSNDVANMLCAPYTANNANTWQGDKTIVVTPFSGIQVWIHDEAYKDNLEAFKAAMQGVILYYEAAEWEWVELDTEDQNFRDYYQVADFGTEQSQSNNVPSAALAADIIYQFNAVDMIREHEAEITELQKVIATMQAQLASLTNS